ncbi:hypothetical protein [Williamsia soli]|uniref:hypothetical protein n=1 Tax=Williamsia soli TaxID=364929 RepID=UPI001A9E8642|nr:hypothetical protein [Williamsia soli]
MPKSAGMVFRSLFAVLMTVGLVATLPAAASADEPDTVGVLPGVGEYRVHSAITLDLGPGVAGGVQRDPDAFKCVNANGEFPFRTTSWLPEVHDLWMDVSVSVVPACFTVKSYAWFDVYVTSPYQGHVEISFQEDEDGQPAQSPFTLTCLGGDSRHLDCHQNNDLSITITCRDEFDSPCPRRSSPLPFPLPDLGSTA